MNGRFDNWNSSENLVSFLGGLKAVLEAVQKRKITALPRMEKISWTDHVRNEEVLLRVNEQRNILHEIRKLKDN